MKKSIVVSIIFFVAILVLFGMSAAVASASSVINVPKDYPTIQEAIDNAVDGTTIRVAAGTYMEQIEIRDLLDLQLQGRGATIKVPADGMKGQLVKVVNCENIKITGFTIDGSNGLLVTPGARNTGGDADTRFYGIFLVNSSGMIADNTIQDVSWGNGVQQGVGIFVLVDDGLFRSINIQNNIIANFQKNGITALGPLSAHIQGNTITGWGDTDVIAQNCIQVGYDPMMTASIIRNILSDARYTGTPRWASTGILATDGNTNLRITNNEISNTTVGVFLYPGSVSSKIIANSGSGNDWDYYSFADDTKIQANKFE